MVRREERGAALDRFALGMLAFVGGLMALVVRDPTLLETSRRGLGAAAALALVSLLVRTPLEVTIDNITSDRNLASLVPTMMKAQDELRDANKTLRRRLKLNSLLWD